MARDIPRAPAALAPLPPHGPFAPRRLTLRDLSAAATLCFAFAVCIWLVTAGLPL
ncbi:MAG: hypothetical protein QM651_02200 [Rhodoblastus sp.]